MRDLDRTTGATIADRLLASRWARRFWSANPAPWSELSNSEIDADPPTMRQLGRAYGEELRAIHSDADRTTDKGCDIFLRIGLIKTIFPYPGSSILETLGRSS